MKMTEKYQKHMTELWEMFTNLPSVLIKVVPEVGFLSLARMLSAVKLLTLGWFSEL